MTPLPLSAYSQSNLERSRARLARVALIFGVTFVFLSTVIGLVGQLVAEVEVVNQNNQHVDILSAGLWLALAGFARSRASDLAVLRAGQVVVVASSFTMAFVSGLTAMASSGTIPIQTVTWATVWIVAYPLLIPTNSRETLRVVALAAGSAPVGVALGMATWGGPVDWPAVVGSAVAPVVGAVLATIGSDLIYRNTVDIQRLEERETLLSTVLGGVDEVVVLRDSDGTEIFASSNRVPGEVLAAEGLMVHQSETWVVTHGDVVMDGSPHVLTVARRLTAHLEEAEVESWKRLIRALSHELNNSLGPMASLLHSMRTVLGNPEQMKHLDDLISAMDRRVDHLTAFLSEYSAFARLPRPRVADVEWASFVEDLRVLVPFEGARDVRGMARFDRGQIEQVVLNLLKNAQESGSATEDVELAIEQQGSDWVISVSDRGAGLSDEVVERGVLPFFSTKPEGTGLGLALCRDIALAHSGRFTLARREGGGAVARVWLPVSVPEAA